MYYKKWHFKNIFDIVQGNVNNYKYVIISIREILENIRDNKMKTNTNFCVMPRTSKMQRHRCHLINASRDCRLYFYSDKLIDTSMGGLSLNIPFFNLWYTKSLASWLYKTLIGFVTAWLRSIQKLVFDFFFTIR